MGRREKQVELLTRERLVGVCRREMRHQPDDVSFGRGQLRQAVPAHPGVELQVDTYPFGNLRVGHRQLETGLARVRDLTVRRGWAHHEDAHAGKLARQRKPLGNSGNAQRSRARAQRRARDVGRPVAVAVRLDDRPELGAVEGADEVADVATQRAEVDRELRAVHVQRLLPGQECIGLSTSVKVHAREGVPSLAPAHPG